MDCPICGHEPVMRTTVRSTVLPLALLLPIATGCVRRTTKEFEAATEPIAAASAPEPVEMRQVVVPADGSGEEASGPVASPFGALRGTHLPPEPALFRLGAGYGALGHIDLAPCRAQGLQAGYLHLRVTFGHNGRVILATVESHLPPPPEALGCIGEQLELAMVPVFDGDDVTLAKSFFVN